MGVVLPLFVLVLFSGVRGLTFELEDRDYRCIYHNAKADAKYFVEFEVLSGEGYHINFLLLKPGGEVFDEMRRTDHGKVFIDSADAGDYQACFDHNFSVMSRTVIYFRFLEVVDDEYSLGNRPLSEVKEEWKMTNFSPEDAKLLQIGLNISMKLHKASGIQLRERVLQTISAKFGEQLNSRVMYWSIGQGILIILVALSQVYTLRSMFKTPTAYHASVPIRSTTTGF